MTAPLNIIHCALKQERQISVQHSVRLRSSIALAAAPASKCTVQTANSCRVFKQTAVAAAQCTQGIAAFKDFELHVAAPEGTLWPCVCNISTESSQT